MFQRKKSSSLKDDLIIGGACIIHNKFNHSKKTLFNIKTGKPLTDSNPNVIEDEQEYGFTFNVSSSQKSQIKYLKHICKQKTFKANPLQSEKDKSQKSLFKKKTTNLQNNIFKQDGIDASQSASKRFRKKLRIIALENSNKRQFSQEKLETTLQRKILPQITQKYRSYTTSNSKKQLQKDMIYAYGQENLIKSLNKPKELKRQNFPLPNLHFSQDESKKSRILRINTTKIQKNQLGNNYGKINFLKQKDQGSSSVTKNIKKEFYSQKDIKMTTEQLSKALKDNKQKNPKLCVIRDQFTVIINKTNSLLVINDSSSFNAFVEKGNNGLLVKEMIKKRWWWHLSEDNPRQNPVQVPPSLKQSFSSNTQSNQQSGSQKKKINLYWSEWLNKGFAEKLQLPNDQILSLKTVYDEPEFDPPEEQQKYQCVKKITDQSTYVMIRDKISLRNVNYFKNRFLKLVQNQDLSKTSQTQDFIANFQKKTKNEGFLRQIKNSQSMKIHNHIIGCLELHSKKLLFKNFSSYLKKKNMNPFQFIPVTFYIEDLISQNYQNFLLYQQKYREQSIQEGSQSIWILKPGQNSNRGFGITIHKQKQQIQEELTKRLNKKLTSEDDQVTKKCKKSVIVQKYIEKCFLINNRKFDFRCYILITTANGFLKGYWYSNGYIRTSSEEYDLSDIRNRMIHLTNDAVQSKNSSFGKFEDYNKMNFEGFKKYLQKQSIPESKFDESFKKMKNIAYYLIASVSPKIKRYQYTFELFGLDFMLDQSLNPFLIQANSNPCLDTKGPILTKIIRNLVDNVIMTAIDPLFPPPKNFQSKKKRQELDCDYFEANMFELIFSDQRN